MARSTTITSDRDERQSRTQATDGSVASTYSASDGHGKGVCDGNDGDCEAKNAHIINKVNGQSLSYGELSDEASKIDLEELPILKKRSAYNIIGKPVQRLDIREKVNGTAGFGWKLA